jgi:hypothetical protein
MSLRQLISSLCDNDLPILRPKARLSASSSSNSDGNICLASPAVAISAVQMMTDITASLASSPRKSINTRLHIAIYCVFGDLE